MKLLFLCNKKYYDNKMSRGRFHYIYAIKHKIDVDIWGIGWDGYNEQLSITDNLENKDYNAILCYKPLEYIKFNELQIPTLLSYNEMYDITKTNDELIKSNPNYVICHHLNELYRYNYIHNNIKFYHIPHCSDTRFFKNYNLPKIYDISLIGRLSNKHYPLRSRMKHILKKMEKKYNINYHNHPGYNIENANDNNQVIEYAKIINQSKICVFCSGIPKTRYAKYVEVPLCNSVICADKPDDNISDIIEINMKMTDNELRKTLIYYLENKTEYNLKLKNGINYMKKYTTDFYANKFINILNNI